MVHDNLMKTYAAVKFAPDETHSIIQYGCWRQLIVRNRLRRIRVIANDCPLKPDNEENNLTFRKNTVLD